MWSHVISQRPRSTADCVLTIIFVSPGKKKKKRQKWLLSQLVWLEGPQKTSLDDRKVNP